MEITVSAYLASDIMKTTEGAALAGGLPFCRYSFSSLARKDGRIGGAGLYACFHRNNLVYIGKYRGVSNDWRSGDIVSLRWVKHVSTFTMLARNLGFSNRAFLDIERAISQCGTFKANIPKMVIDGFQSADPAVLQRETGCMTTFQRFKVAIDVWNQAEGTLEPNLDEYKFIYARINGEFSNSEARDLVSAAEKRALEIAHPLGNTIPDRRAMELPDPLGVADLFEETLKSSSLSTSIYFSNYRPYRKGNPPTTSTLEPEVNISEPEENMSDFQKRIEDAPDFAQDFVSELQFCLADLADADIEFTDTPDMRVRKLSGKVSLGFRNCVRFEWQPRNQRVLMYSSLSSHQLENHGLLIDKSVSNKGELSNITYLTKETLINKCKSILKAVLFAHSIFKI